MNEYHNILSIVKKVLSNRSIPFAKLILFGSRANGTYDEYSDFDFCLLIDESLSTTQKIKLNSEIQRLLLNSNYLLPMDLVIKNLSEYNIEINEINSLAWEINRTGIVI